MKQAGLGFDGEVWTVREVHLTCDNCGTVEVTEGYSWPNGWYHWRQQDLCHDCAAPQIVAAMRDCSDEEYPTVIGP